MDGKNFLAEQFEANRAHLRGVAYRMLGSLGEAEDAVQETWLRLSRSDANDIANMRGWLTTVIARVCLDLLRARKSRREDPLDSREAEPQPRRDPGMDPEDRLLMAESVGLAMLVVLQKLAPAERIAFVLHDMFDVPFEQIASVVGRTPAAARQLASRARRRVQGRPPEGAVDQARHGEIVEAFLAASRGGDFDALLSMLDPEVVFRADDAAAMLGGPRELRGASQVAKAFAGRARAAAPALVDGAVGIVVVPDGQLKLVLGIEIRDGRIVEVHAIADPDRLSRISLGVLN